MWAGALRIDSSKRAGSMVHFKIHGQTGGSDGYTISSVYVPGHGGGGYQDDGSDNRLPGGLFWSQGNSVWFFDRGGSGPGKNADTKKFV